MLYQFIAGKTHYNVRLVVFSSLCIYHYYTYIGICVYTYIHKFHLMARYKILFSCCCCCYSLLQAKSFLRATPSSSLHYPYFMDFKCNMLHERLLQLLPTTAKVLVIVVVVPLFLIPVFLSCFTFANISLY